MAPGRDREARRRDRAPESPPARERAREEAPAPLPRDPFGRRDGRGSARLDFLFDARRPDPESGAPRSPHAVHVPPAPPAEPGEERKPSPAPAPTPAPRDADAEAFADLELPPLPLCADLTPPPFEPPPAPPVHAEAPAPVVAPEHAEAPAVEPPASLYSFAPPPRERPRGFKNPAIPTGIRAFVPPRFAGIVETAAGLVRGLAVALLSRGAGAR